MKGGPKNGASVEYASMNDGIAVVQKSSGKLSANSIGNAVSTQYSCLTWMLWVYFLHFLQYFVLPVNDNELMVV